MSTFLPIERRLDEEVDQTKAEKRRLKRSRVPGGVKKPTRIKLVPKILRSNGEFNLMSFFRMKIYKFKMANWM